MKRLRDLPIRTKLMVIILLTSGAAVVAMRLAFFGYEYFTFKRATVQQITTVGEVIARNSTAALIFVNSVDAGEILSALDAHPYMDAAALYDAEGALFARYPADYDVGRLPAVPDADGHRFAGAQLTVVQPVVQGDRRIGTLFLRLDTGEILRIWLWGTLWPTLGVLAAGFVVAWIVSERLQRQVSRPILALTETARTISEQRDYSVRAAKQGADELGTLTESINQMLDQIEQRDHAIRQLNEELERRVMQRTAQLEAANKELEAFSYSISHDLRAPLRHIDGFAQLLRKQAAGALDEKGSRYLETIISSAKGLGLLIDELLSFSRMGRSEMHHVEVDMHALVREVINEFAQECAGRTIDWQVQALPRAEGDPALLRQVWRNLIGNAVKYTRQRDRAVIRITHRSDAKLGSVYSIEDNGAGFEMEYASKLFGVFQRLHSASEFEGTGIGLANVRRIVQRHGGLTWAEGRRGVGATFNFSLPNSPGPAQL